jgi:hypothetical protein
MYPLGTLENPMYKEGTVVHMHVIMGEVECEKIIV